MCVFPSPPQLYYTLVWVQPEGLLQLINGDSKKGLLFFRHRSSHVSDKLGELYINPATIWLKLYKMPKVFVSMWVIYDILCTWIMHKLSLIVIWEFKWLYKLPNIINKALKISSYLAEYYEKYCVSITSPSNFNK